MADGIYIGMAGAVARADQLEAISDNLANSETMGFKKATPTFEAFLAQSQSKDQSFPVAVATAFDMTQGATLRTDERLDVIPNAGSFLAVKNGDSVAFTRAGHLTLDGNGFLSAAGLPVLDSGGQAIRVPDNKQPEIRTDGTVYAAGERLGQLATFALSGPLERAGGQLIRPQSNGHATQVESGMHVGELELSNTSPLICAVQMVSVQRYFEAAMQSIQTYRQLDQRAADIGRVR
jgi:flagellar basal-body rod protein FlgF